MRKTLKDRFQEVDRVPTPWDEGARGLGHVADRRSRTRSVVLGLLAASLAVAAAVAVLFVNPEPQSGPDASWLLGEAQARCVEAYSPNTLPNRSWAFEGVISAVEGPVDPTGEDAGQGTSTVTFDVDRWFWGGSGEQISLRTYASPSSVREVDESVGAHLLVSGEGDFVWPCGFTRPFSDKAQTEFEAAAVTRTG